MTLNSWGGGRFIEVEHILTFLHYLDFSAHDENIEASLFSDKIFKKFLPELNLGFWRLKNVQLEPTIL